LRTAMRDKLQHVTHNFQYTHVSKRPDSHFEC
jgi:hypothetical protein